MTETITQNPQLEQLESRLQPYREQLLQHRLYQQLKSEAALRTFMQHHAFAVLDFMWLLKKLQQQLTCVEVPWKPPANASASRLVNEIVLGEESDLSEDGHPASHFELYVAAMQQCGADVGPLNDFVRHFDGTDDELRKAAIPPAAASFMATTLKIIHSEDSCQVAAAFTFGRENLLPDVFEQIVAEVNERSDGRFDRLVYYLNRHIELDGDEHGGMAVQLVSDLCGQDRDRWQAAEEAAVQALEARLQLWDAIADDISGTQNA